MYLDRVKNYDNDKVIIRENRVKTFEDLFVRPNEYDLPIMKQQYTSESTCNGAVTNCKAGYYGVDESDPFVSTLRCTSIDGKWTPRCRLRGNRLQSDGNVMKFLDDFQPANNVMSEAYMEFITDICEFHKDSPACKNFTVTLFYDVGVHNSPSMSCADINNKLCIPEKYGYDYKDPWFSNPGCAQNPYGNEGSRCTFDNFITEIDGLRVFGEEFEDSVDSIKYLFLSSPGCREHNYTDPACDWQYRLSHPGDNFATKQDCDNYLNANPTYRCKFGDYSPLFTLAYTDYCPEKPNDDGKWRVACDFSGALDITDNTAKKIHELFFSHPDKHINEMNYKQILKRYCLKPENRYKEQCLFNTHSKCQSEPWLTSCGGPGDKCIYDPSLLECTSDCKDHPWMTVCGGDGNPCPTEPSTPGCEVCKDSPWLEMCGGTDPCVTSPGSSACCTANPTHSSCQSSNPCVTSPGSSACCTAQPTHSSCQSSNPCVTSPGSSACCTANPTHSSCQSSSPCSTSPGSSACCTGNPTHSSCQSSNPCVTSPGSRECCKAQPTHSSCDDSSRIFLILIIGAVAFIMFNK